MMDATLRIKNLSIALKAISRVNTSTSHELSRDIESLLAQEIFAFRKETLWPRKAPAKPNLTDPFADDNPF